MICSRTATYFIDSEMIKYYRKTYGWNSKSTKNKNYSQTCSNNHLYKTTTCLRWPMLSPPKPISMKSLLYKTTTCLTRQATTFFVPQMKKNKNKPCLKQPLQNFIQWGNGKQCIKNKHLSNYIYSIATL